jgi:predicted NBD/HSP70 family sugar kinase
MSSTVFISHTGQDQSLAGLFCRHLEDAGVDCWIAPRDVHAGQRYAEAIVEAIEDCSVFLLLFSRESVRSPHVSNEIEKAASKNKPILLVRTDDTDPNDSHEICLFVASHQWFDMSTGDILEALPRLVGDVRRLLEHQEVPKSSGDLGLGRNSSTQTAAPPNMSSTRAIGIDIGSTTIRGWVEALDGVTHIFDSGRYLDTVRRPTTPRSVLEQVRDMIDRLLAEHFDGHEPPVGVGIAAPGPVDVRTGTLKFSPGLGLRNVPFKTVLANTYPEIRFRVDNDTRCATRAELHFGVGREFNDFACIFVGSGVGSGVAIGKQLHFGNSYCAGEIGHVKIESSGPPCTCGQIGCLETFVNGPAIAARARAKAIDWEGRGAETLLTAEDRLTPEMVVAAIEDGDLAALEIADELADRLGVGIANYLNLLNPAAIVLGGGVMSGFYLHIIGRLTHTLHENALADVAQTPIVQSQFTDTGPALGAALMFHQADAWPFD